MIRKDVYSNFSCLFSLDLKIETQGITFSLFLKLFFVTLFIKEKHSSEFIYLSVKR